MTPEQRAELIQLAYKALVVKRGSRRKLHAALMEHAYLRELPLRAKSLAATSIINEAIL